MSEENYNINFGYSEECDKCLDSGVCIQKYDPYYETNRENYIIFNGKNFICRECCDMLYGN